MRHLFALIPFLALAVAIGFFAPRTPVPKRDPAATPRAADDTCTGPRLRTQTVPNLLAPGGEREAICGFVAVRGEHYAWTRHALFVRSEEASENGGWVLTGRSHRTLARVVALRSGGLAIVEPKGELLAHRDDKSEYLSPFDDELTRFDLAVTDAARAHLEIPRSPLACLASARSSAVTVVKHHRFDDPGSFAVSLAIDALGRARRTNVGSSTSIAMRASDASVELARLEEALYLADDGATFTEVRVEWTCDQRSSAMTLAGLRAKRVQEIVVGWLASGS